MTVEQLRKIQTLNLSIVNENVDKSISTHSQVKQYIAQIQNPYLSSSAGIAIKIKFGSSTRTLEETIRSYLTAQKSIVK